MKGSVAIILLSIHLAGNTELGQLLRFPQLLQHFRDHQRADSSLDFFHFILMHYAGDDGKPGDDQQEKGLPCHDLSHTSLVTVFDPQVTGLPSVAPHIAPRVPVITELPLNITAKHVRKLLQPPRIA